jgi:PAS domain S-box-containing protein
MNNYPPFLSDAELLGVYDLTKVATAIHISEEAIIQTANQAMLDTWGKDKSVIGKSLEEALPELKGQPFIDLFKKVWNEGITVSGTSTAAHIEIDGQIKTFYFDYEYRAILNADGKSKCILHTATDVTDRVIGQQAIEFARQKAEALIREQELNDELAATNEELQNMNDEFIKAQEELRALNADLENLVSERVKELQESNDNFQALNEEYTSLNEDLESTIDALSSSETMFRSMVEQSPVAIALCHTSELVIDIVNDTMLEIWGKSAEINGMPLAKAMPELEGQPFLGIMKNVILTGEPYYAFENPAHVNRNGKRIDGYFNFICQPVKNKNGIVDSVLQVVTEVTDQVLARQEVQKSQQMMQMAIDAAKLGSWFIDPITKALTYNDMLATLYGYEGDEPMTYEQAIGQVSEEYRPVILAEIDKAIKTTGDYDFTYMQRRFNDDELMWLRSIGKVSHDEQSGETVFSGFVMDITEMKKDEQRKNDFIGIVSHELKTPLTSLNGYIQLLYRQAKKEQNRYTTDALATAQRQVQKMTTMINGFLNISRLESGKIVLDKSTFEIGQLIKTLIEESSIIDKSHQVTYEACEATSVYADRDKISNVFSNLLSNAIKYSPSNPDIIVTCNVLKSEVVIGIKDFGMGISKEDAELIFKRYHRVEGNPTISGFGIGLYLSAEIIDRHHGKIWVDSELGKGSTFYFSLPL